MIKIRKTLLLSAVIIYLLSIHATAFAMLAGGRPNAISQGQNAFAGVINPANAVWIENRIDIGGYLVRQNSSLTNVDNNPFFPKGKMDLTYHTKYLLNFDAAIHKKFHLNIGCRKYETSFTLATYTVPNNVKLCTKMPLELLGTTPMMVLNRTNVLSSIFSFKLDGNHSIGFSIDCLYLSYRRYGFQRSDDPKQSVAPGYVTNNGTDHSWGVGLSLGYRWNITKKLIFGAAWIKKSPCGQFKNYRGYEPYHAKNYFPQFFGAGFTYLFTKKTAGRLEVLWSNLSNVPNANNSVLPDGSLNLNKRGSNKSPGPGLQNATNINVGLGTKVSDSFSIGAGYSHRMRLPRKSPLIISHSYMLQTIYDLLSFGANYVYYNNEFFFVCSHGFKNKTYGLMPETAGGGHFIGRRETNSVSLSWGYKY